MSGVLAAAVVGAVVAAKDSEVSGGSGAGGSVIDGGGGGERGSGFDNGRYDSLLINGHSNVTHFLLDLVSDIAATVTPAALRQANSSTSPSSSSSSPTTATTLLGSTTTLVGNDSFGVNVTTVDPFGQRPESGYEVWEQTIIGLILGTLILGTIIGNCLVCTSVAIVKRLRTPSNLLIVSLAVADLLVAILVMPLAGTLQMYGAWILGPTVCDMWTTTDVLLCTASILNLCMISVDRYFVITRPLEYAMKRTPKRMGVMIAIVWSVSAVVSIPPVFGWKSPHEPYNCFISQDIGYQIYATLCSFYLPLFVMIFVYFKIWRVSAKIAKAEARSKVGSFDKGVEFQVGRPSRDSNDSQFLPNGSLSKKHHNGSGDADDASLEILPKNSDNDRLKQRRFTLRSLLPNKKSKYSGSTNSNSFKERKATKTLGVIMGCFTLCWLPFFILALYKTFCGNDCQVPIWLDSILMWLGYANSFLNPVIYARFNRDFRTPFKEILCFRCRGINMRMRSESYVEQYGGDHNYRDSLRPPLDCIVRYHSQGQTVVHLGNGSANSQSETKI